MASSVKVESRKEIRILKRHAEVSVYKHIYPTNKLSRTLQHSLRPRVAYIVLALFALLVAQQVVAGVAAYVRILG